jgi:hypothetical protein
MTRALLGNGPVNTRDTRSQQWNEVMQHASAQRISRQDFRTGTMTSHCNSNSYHVTCALCCPCGAYITNICLRLSQSVLSRVGVGSNTSTVTLRVVGDDEKGSLKSETVKYGRESQGTRIRERLRWQGPAAYTKDRPILS